MLPSYNKQNTETGYFGDSSMENKTEDKNDGYSNFRNRYAPPTPQKTVDPSTDREIEERVTATLIKLLGKIPPKALGDIQHQQYSKILINEDGEEEPRNNHTVGHDQDLTYSREEIGARSQERARARTDSSSREHIHFSQERSSPGSKINYITKQVKFPKKFLKKQKKLRKKSKKRVVQKSPKSLKRKEKPLTKLKKSMSKIIQTNKLSEGTSRNDPSISGFKTTEALKSYEHEISLKKRALDKERKLLREEK